MYVYIYSIDVMNVDTSLAIDMHISFCELCIYIMTFFRVPIPLLSTKVTKYSSHPLPNLAAICIQ